MLNLIKYINILKIQLTLEIYLINIYNGIVKMIIIKRGVFNGI